MSKFSRRKKRNDVVKSRRQESRKNRTQSMSESIDASYLIKACGVPPSVVEKLKERNAVENLRLKIDTDTLFSKGVSLIEEQQWEDAIIFLESAKNKANTMLNLYPGHFVATYALHALLYFYYRSMADASLLNVTDVRKNLIIAMVYCCLFFVNARSMDDVAAIRIGNPSCTEKDRVDYADPTIPEGITLISSIVEFLEEISDNMHPNHKPIKILSPFSDVKFCDLASLLAQFLIFISPVGILEKYEFNFYVTKLKCLIAASEKYDNRMMCGHAMEILSDIPTLPQPFTLMTDTEWTRYLPKIEDASKEISGAKSVAEIVRSLCQKYDIDMEE